MRKQNVGVIYIATGKKYVDEALVSAATLKKHVPDLPVTLFSDLDVKSSYFDRIIKIKNPVFGFEDKIRQMPKTPYDLTLFLDTDTYICDDISELFDLLDRFDIAARHANRRKQYFIENVPGSFTELNSGVVVFKKSNELKLLFSNWLKFYLRDKKKDLSELYTSEIIRYCPETQTRESKVKVGFKKKIDYLKKRKFPRGINDQPTFREALYKSKLRMAILPSKYNMRKKGFVNGKVKIIHGRYWDFGLVERVINSSHSPRVFVWSFDRLHVFSIR